VRNCRNLSQFRPLDINYDADQTAAYYGKPVAVRDLAAGTVPGTKADALKQALADASHPIHAPTRK
jgi:hypothetical protein